MNLVAKEALEGWDQERYAYFRIGFLHALVPSPS